jgi:hypothetical protein
LSSKVDYSGAIQINFDRPILTDPEIVTGSEYYRLVIAPEAPVVALSSGDYAGFGKALAFDGYTTTWWRSAATTSPQWIGRDFGAEVTLTKIRAYFDTQRANAYKVQGSHNGADWFDVASGNFSNVSGWQESAFAAATYRYWRLYITSIYNAAYYVQELEFYATRNTYNVAGWAVSSQERRYQPEGDLITNAYIVRKVTKTPDSLGLILWLDMRDRLRAPEGEITIAYDKTAGNLRGMGDIPVESFSITFTPASLTPAANPADVEYLTALSKMTVGVVAIVYRYDQAQEYLTATAKMALVVTNVGGLPL